MRCPSFIYDVICTDSQGQEKWRECVHNLVTNVGKNDIIDKYFKGSAYNAAWYCGLKAVGSISANDSLASHAGWGEVTPYAGNRLAIAFGATASGSNTASGVVFAINATATIAGAFIANAASGTSGVLYSVSDFSVARSVANGDNLTITPTISVA